MRPIYDLNHTIHYFIYGPTHGCCPIFESSMYHLGYEVDKPSKILIKTLNEVEYIKLDIENIETPINYDHIIKYV